MYPSDLSQDGTKGIKWGAKNNEDKLGNTISVLHPHEEKRSGGILRSSYKSLVNQAKGEIIYIYIYR